MTPSSTEFLIVGQGLAGTVLAWCLLQRGRSFTIIDREAAVSSSKVAAGLITPITGKKLTKNWRIDESLPIAWSFYCSLEAVLDAQFIHEMPVVRVFETDDEVHRWENRRQDPEFQPYFFNDSAQWLDPQLVECRLGGFATKHSGYLDVAAFLAASRQHFRTLGCYQVSDSPQDFTTETTVYCEGAEAASNPLFDWLPFKSAKGEILSLEIEAADLPRDRIYSRGLWLLPTVDGRFRTGSTYVWDQLDNVPTAAGRESIELRLKQWLKVPFRVVDHQAAVRPIVRYSMVLIGRHPAHDHVAIFNALGSKGVSYAPFFGAQLADHLCGNGLIDPEVDLRKNL